ncbi:MAG: reverse gyrase [Desulfurococcales archaeon]
MDNDTYGIYMNQCPNCDGHISDGRLVKGLVCEKCLPESPSNASLEKLLKILENRNALKRLRSVYEVERSTSSFIEMFEKALGYPPWSSQITWAKRIFQRKSFSIIAPTGVGKTVFGLMMSLYLGKNDGKSYLIFPTTPLVIQMCEKLKQFNAKANAIEDDGIICIHAGMKQSEKNAAIEKLMEGKFRVFISTSKYMINKNNELSRLGFNFIFIDDVDSVLKSKKSIDSTLKLMGFNEEIIETALKVIKLRRKIAYMGKEASEKDLRELEKLERKVEKSKDKVKSVLVVSSATGKARGSRALLFRELLGFQIGGRTELFRNVEDLYEEVENEELENKLIELVSKLGKGGLIFVPSDMGTAYATKLTEELKKGGISAEPFHHKSQKVLNDFVKGEIDVLVGVAVYYGVMVRGLDLPSAVRYAVFVRPPRFKFSLDLVGAHPISIVKLLSAISEAKIPKISDQARRFLIPLRRSVRRLSPAALTALSTGSQISEGLEPILKQLNESKQFLKAALEIDQVRKALMDTGDVFIEKDSRGEFIVIPDAKTYIQATGRTSRLYAGGLTKGLAVTLVKKDELPLLFSLQKTLSYYIDRFSFKKLSEVNLEEIIKEIDRDRRSVVEVLSGKEAYRLKELVKTALMIVESPNKARTISNFFGRPSVRVLPNGGKAYEVTIGNLTLTITATEGHVVDLVPRAGPDVLEYAELSTELYGVAYDRKEKKFLPVYSTIKKCRDCGYQFVEDSRVCPRCGSSRIFDKKEVIESLRELATEFDKVLVATDPDAEGEKIGWDIAVLLRPLSREVKRIEFHEVTRRAILEALSNERLIDEKLVCAQIVRRIEDRWIGFSLSKKLQTDFWPEYCKRKGLKKCKENKNLSAGRVQTPVLGWIIDRYNQHVKSDRTVKVVQAKLGGTLREIEFVAQGKEDEKANDSTTLKIEVLGEERIKMNPLPPFTTDTMISEANKALRLSAHEVMALAQDLFELGLITYHRTDSTRVSSVGIEIAKEYLKKLKGDKWADYFVPRSWGEGGAHEAIRPTKPISKDELARLLEEGEIEFVRTPTSKHLSLYDLIFRRFVASQMRPAEYLVQKVRLKFGELSKEMEIQTDVIYEQGFMELYIPFKLDKPLPSGEFEISAVRSYKRRLVPLFTQGDIVALMRERGIGRPSTYATIISKLQSRKYVVESKRFGKLIPTELGINIFNYLSEKFSNMVSEERTRSLELKMDSVSEGKLKHSEVIAELYREIETLEGLEDYRK